MSATPLWRAARVAYEDVHLLREALGIGDPLAWTLVRRGLRDPEQAREFLAADGELAPPEAIHGIAEAAERIARAVARRERIVVHGDYDCDGVVSTALLVSALRARGADVGHVLPSRFEEGYGVALSTVDRLADEGCRLLVCVDCGTSAVDALSRAVDAGMECVVLDHHLAGGVRPPAIIANPALGRPAPDLPAAAGVVHHLVRALAARLPDGVLVPDPADDLDLVALATVADAVPLIGDNRRMVVRGLARLREATRPGIAALCAAAGTEPRLVDARALGFRLAPCINAAGRLAHPDRALELLLARDMDEALPIARELWQLNLDRREVERAIVDEAIAMVEAEAPEIRDAPAIVVAGDGWHEGVVGIVASRLVDHFGRPAIVIARDGDRGKGSGRSLPGIDLHTLVGQADTALGRWGGHAGAIGLELPSSRIGEFRDELIRCAAGIDGAIARARVRSVDAVVGCPELTLDTAEALEALAPFGRGNPAVRLAVPAVRVESPQRVGQGRHLQLRIASGGANARGIGFDMGPRAASLDLEARHDLVIALEVERWQGVVGPRLRLRALEPVGAHGGDPEPTLPAPTTGAERVGIDAALIGRGVPDLIDAVVPGAPPRGVRDLRGEGAAVATITALAGADRGVVVVVADVDQRAAGIREVLAPARTGVETIDVLHAGQRPEVVAARLRAADGAVAFIVIEHEALTGQELPPGTHVAVLDPPCLPREDIALMCAAGGHWLHLLWGADEARAASSAAERAWSPRPVAAALWPLLRDGGHREFGTAFDDELLAAARCHAPVAARALAALCEIGLLRVDDRGLRALPDAPRADLAAAPTARACAVRLEASRARLADWRAIDPRRSIVPVRDIVHT